MHVRSVLSAELVQAGSTAIVLRSVPSTALLAPGDKLIAMLGDHEADPEEMHALVDAAIAGGELAYLGVSTARDRFGKSALHISVTRGDATLCRKLLRRREDDLGVGVVEDLDELVMHLRELLVVEVLLDAPREHRELVDELLDRGVRRVVSPD